MAQSERYRVLSGVDYPARGGAKRAEPGEVISDLPPKSIGWLLEQGHIERVTDGIRPQ